MAEFAADMKGTGTPRGASGPGQGTGMAGRRLAGHYDLEERTFEFARRVRAFVKRLPDTMTNREDIPQLVRASGSVGANYIEANDALGKKDFVMKIRTSRREAKESRYWLRLVDVGTDELVAAERADLVREATELVKIFGSILRNSAENREKTNSR